MTKAQLVNKISEETGIEKVVVLATIESFMDTVKESLMKEEPIFLRGFGSFILKTRAKKIARNITKNTAIVVPEHKIPAFKPVKSFSEKIKEMTIKK